MSTATDNRFDTVFTAVLNILTENRWEADAAQDVAHDYAYDTVYGSEPVGAAYRAPTAKRILDAAGYMAPGCVGVHTHGTEGIWSTCHIGRLCRSCS